MILDEKVKALFASAAAVKVLATIGPDGEPHAALDPSIHLDRDGQIVYRELLESSRTQRDLVASLWHERPVTVIVAEPGGAAFRIVGRPRKAHVAGPIFREHYERVRAERLGVDLAAVWIIVPQSVADESYERRRARQDAERPFFKHLDQLASS